MESEWAIDRIRLFQLCRDPPDWRLNPLAHAVGYNLTWMKNGSDASAKPPCRVWQCSKGSRVPPKRVLDRHRRAGDDPQMRFFHPSGLDKWWLNEDSYTE